MRWSLPGLSVAVPPAGTTRPPALGCMTMAPSLSTTSWISIMPALGLAAAVMVTGLLPEFASIPKAPVISVSVAFTQVSVAVIGQRAASGLASAVVPASEAQAARAPSARSDAEAITRRRRARFMGSSSSCGSCRGGLCRPGAVRGPAR